MQTLIHDALSCPVGYPSLSQIVFPEDRILLVPDAEYARKPKVLAQIAIAFIEAGALPGDLSILLTEEEEERRTGKILRTLLPDGVLVAVHYPLRRDLQAVLGINVSDRPILLPRQLIDADLIVSIGRFRRGKRKGYFGVHTAIYPHFSDQPTQARFAAAASALEHRKLCEEVEEVAKLLGVFFTVQFRCDRDQPAHVVAGLPEGVVKQLKRYD